VAAAVGLVAAAGGLVAAAGIWACICKSWVTWACKLSNLVCNCLFSARAFFNLVASLTMVLAESMEDGEEVVGDLDLDEECFFFLIFTT